MGFYEYDRTTGGCYNVRIIITPRFWKAVATSLSWIRHPYSDISIERREAIQKAGPSDSGTGCCCGLFDGCDCFYITRTGNDKIVICRKVRIQTWASIPWTRYLLFLKEELCPGLLTVITLTWITEELIPYFCTIMYIIWSFIWFWKDRRGILLTTSTIRCKEGTLQLSIRGVTHGESPMSGTGNSSISVGVSNLFIDDMQENCMTDHTFFRNTSAVHRNSIT